jgi:hypothetical protein
MYVRTQGNGYHAALNFLPPKREGRPEREVEANNIVAGLWIFLLAENCDGGEDGGHTSFNARQ